MLNSLLLTGFANLQAIELYSLDNLLTKVVTVGFGHGFGDRMIRITSSIRLNRLGGCYNFLMRRFITNQEQHYD